MPPTGCLGVAIRAGIPLLTLGEGEGEGRRPADGCGRSHMVNIVTIEGQRYMVDVGFGSNGPTHPLPLVHDEVTYGIGPQEVRLLHTRIEQHTDPTQKTWVFEHHNDKQSPWMAAYSFTELEFLPPDYTIMNFYTSTSRTSFFTYTVICTKMVMERDDIVGTLTLFVADVKRRIRGKTDHLESCETEEQRIGALEKYFGIALSEEEKDGIRGMVTELKG
ncbi:MAG: N-terminal acetyltransferase [Candelina mexicana]|nr:MAG: N-terminal acetyltransferase [Candelina mexicana]